jgi:hypothetical protein
MKQISICVAVAAAITLCTQSASAHVPYLESEDFDFAAPFIAWDGAQSIAVYSWLESAGDIDVYWVVCNKPTDFYVELLVPVCPAYARFFPQFALIGPGLPAPSVPIGLGVYRATMAPWADRTEPRKTFYEPFGGKSYYEGPDYDARVGPGLYLLLVWDPEGNSGDYVVGIGKEERFPLPDLIRALTNTPIIRRNEELHSPCGSSDAGAPAVP